MIAENLAQLKDRIKRTCQKAGRESDDIVLVAVSKTFPVQAIVEAFNAGQLDFGENYVQELKEKQTELLNKPIRWHFVGHLQTNKVKYIADYIHLIHSVDSLNLGREIDKRAKEHNRVIDVLIEVKTTAEATKYGVAPENVIPLLKDLSGLSNLKVTGLMTMGPMSENPEDSRPSFRILSELRKQAVREGFDLEHLSMGMTNDFEVAIEEGATILRIGTAIFGKRLN